MTAKRPPDLIHDTLTDRYSIVTRSKPNPQSTNPNARIAITKYDCTDMFVALAAEWAMRALAKVSGHKFTVIDEIAAKTPDPRYEPEQDTRSYAERQYHTDSSGDPCK